MKYFKKRKPFSFKNNIFDIGSPIGSWNGYEDNHFLLKLYSLPEKMFPSYYEYHLEFFLGHDGCDKKLFFEHIYQIVVNRIKYYQKQNPFSLKSKSYSINIEKLNLFKAYLDSLDSWQGRSLQSIIIEKEKALAISSAEIVKLKNIINDQRRFDVSLKVMISEGYLPTFIDLIQQMRELSVANNRKLLRSDHKIPFAKMISKYFSHGGKDIPIETARNYFVDDNKDMPIKGTAIQADQKLFRIVPVKPTKK